MSFSGLFHTTQLGSVEVTQQRILTFPKGIPGFEHCHNWHLFHEEKNDPVVFWLQSLDDPDVMLNVIDPAILGVGYHLALTESERHELQVQDDHPLVALLILSRSGTQQRIQAQTHAPIIINLQTQRGLQKMGAQCQILPSAQVAKDDTKPVVESSANGFLATQYPML